MSVCLKGGFSLEVSLQVSVGEDDFSKGEEEAGFVVLMSTSELNEQKIH